MSYVRSQGLLNVFSHSLHLGTSLTGGAFFLRRPIDRSTSSSEQSLSKVGDIDGLSDDLITSPFLREIVWPSLIRTSSAGRPL